MTEHNNPPAFPSKKRIHKAGYATAEFEPVNGMTLLDHFAGLAMPVIAAEIYSLGRRLDGGTVPELAAKMAYEMADTMLKERAKWVK